ncbi:hypothetical protein [Eubacterium sp. 1001713B170207_170306_E7]|uniref:hypothetical protein n=1 Tax=Eubacterium sp. 1001713B170207_170306_E7 TaxID=2787097 RepID=UPI001898DC44|nr:hypothetical protein [Eubacterium sp. 1001713B170207_170306_E7]
MYEWYDSPQRDREAYTKLKVDRFYISVLAAFDLNGKVRPLRLKLPDERKCDIDEILEIHESPGLRAGALGTRFVCRIGESERVINLFYENPRWYIERPAP